MIEKITCPQCSSLYSLYEKKLFNKDTDTADCEVCGEVLRSWSNDTTVWQAQLIERKEKQK